MKKYCPIFRENTEKIFPDLVSSSGYGDTISASIVNTQCYQESELPHVTEQKTSKMVVEVVNMDSIECARKKIIEELKDDNPCILNMASDKKAGGGYAFGKKAQEESLCRRTLLYHCLDDYCRKEYSPKSKKKWYPLGSDNIIYSPKVLTIRDVNNNLLKEEEYYTCSYISCAALRHPEVDGDYLKSSKDAKTMLNKWKAVLRVAAFHKHKNIVLSSWGSGAFGNPPQHIGELLYQLLYNDKEFENAFEHVFIAILDPYLNTQNFKVYSEIFQPAETVEEESKEVIEKQNLSKSQRRRLREKGRKEKTEQL